MSGEEIVLTTEARLPALRLLAAAARGVLEDWQLPEDQRGLLELALVEAATNVVRHAYKGREGATIALALGRDGAQMWVSIRDRGSAFDPSSIPEPEEPDPDDPSTWPEGGMGLPIMRSACDRLEYLTTPDGENRLTLHFTVREEGVPRPKA